MKSTANIPLNIVFIASEAAPLAKSGGLADVTGALPCALQAQGHQLSIILPFYRRDIAASGVVTEALNKSIEIWIDGITRYAPLHRAEINGISYILVEQDDFFDRDGLYGKGNDAYEDNLLRFVFFNRVALEAAARLHAHVDVIHCHDWQTGMIPLLLKTQYQHLPAIAQAKTVYTIHNLAYQGVFGNEWIHRLGLPDDYFHLDGYEFHGHINCMKAGIAAADALTTVSPTYAEEILTPAYGCQLEGFLRHHQQKLRGIVNGLDLLQYDPATDENIARSYTAGRMTGKKTCKQALQQECELAPSENTPLLVLVSRLAEQKGVDLILARLESWLAQGWQCVFLGSGDPWLENQLHAMAASHSQQMYFYCGFSNALAHRIYAGGDIFLMPSRFEPCGLGQLIAMRYGTLPVVRRTGGLADTVVDYHQDKRNSTGIAFDAASAEALDQAVQTAVRLYQQRHIWSRMRGRAMRRDSSWNASAASYADVYTGRA